MTTWNNGPNPPPDPNRYYTTQQQGYLQQSFPGLHQPGNNRDPYNNQQGYPPTSVGFVSQPAREMYASPHSGGEDGSIKGFDFTENSIRRGFIRKVYSILMVQLSITLGFIALFVYHKPTQEFVQKHTELLIIALVVFFVCLIVMVCCGEVVRKVPINYIFLILFTVAEAFFLGIISSSYDSEEVLMAVGITAAVCLGLTLFAFQTKIDFTMLYGVLFVALLIFVLFGFVAIFLPSSRLMSMVYASIGALLFSVYLIADTQFMMGGKHKYAISPEDYIFAALNLYVDIINIFMYILSIIGLARN